MFMGYSWDRYLELLWYCIFVFVLFTGTFISSCIIVNKTNFLHMNKKRRNKLNKNKKKSYFINVA